MAASYPAAIRSFTLKHNVTDINFAEHINELQDEVTSMQRILGINPHGTYSNVISRLNGVDTSLANKAALTHTHPPTGGGGGGGGSYLPLDGSVAMTGLLTLPAQDPTNNNQATRKAYVDKRGVIGEDNGNLATNNLGTSNVWANLPGAQITINKQGGTGTSVYLMWTFTCFADYLSSPQFGAFGNVQHRIQVVGTGNSGSRIFFFNVSQQHLTIAGTGTITGVPAGTATARIQVNPGSMSAGNGQLKIDGNDSFGILALET